MNNMMALFQGVQQFRQQMQGQNPDQIINKLMQSGKVSQAQYNHARQMADLFQRMINPARRVNHITDNRSLGLREGSHTPKSLGERGLLWLLQMKAETAEW